MTTCLERLIAHSHRLTALYVWFLLRLRSHLA